MNPSPLTQGIVCALWTPLTPDGLLDLALLDSHLDWLHSTGLSGLLALGSTGRFAHLPVPMREEFLRHVLKRAAGFPTLVNVSALDFRALVRLGGAARDAGAQGIAVLPTWFYHQAQADLVEWFVAAGEAAKLPLWLYNFPERTGNRIELGTVKDVLARTNLAGFKQSGDEHDFIHDLAKLAETTPFAVFAGADARIPESLALGAAGCIGGLANALPEAMVRVFQACTTGDVSPAANELALLRELSQRLHLVPFPMNIAAVMEARGLNPGALPPTMSRVTRAHYEQLKSEARGLMEQHGVRPID